MNAPRTRRTLAMLVLLLLAGAVLAALLLVGMARLPTLPAPSAAPKAVEPFAGEAVDFASRLVRFDGPEAVEQQMQLASRSLRTLYEQADALDRQRMSVPNPDAADLNPVFAPAKGETPSPAARSAWIFGRIEAWQPGALRLRQADALLAEVDVDLQLAGEPPMVAPARLLLVREAGSWRLDDVLHGPDGRDGSLRGRLREID